MAHRATVFPLGRLRTVDRWPGHAAGENGLCRRQVADRNGGNVLGVRGGEFGVDLLVVLAIVADEQPAHLGELLGQPGQRRPLVFPAAAEPSVVRRPPVGQQQRAGGVEVTGKEAGQRRSDIPGTGRQVEHRGTWVRVGDSLVEDRHPWHRHAGVLIEHECVPRGEKRPGQRGHHDGVVDVGDESESDRRVDDPCRRLDRVCAFDTDANGGPPRREHPFAVFGGHRGDVDDSVDEAGTVRARFLGTTCRFDDDARGPDGDGQEATPAAHLGGLWSARVRAGQHDAAHHPDPVRPAVAGVRDDRDLPPAPAQPWLDGAMERILQSRGAMRLRYRLSLVGCGRHGSHTATSRRGDFAVSAELTRPGRCAKADALLDGIRPRLDPRSEQGFAREDEFVGDERSHGPLPVLLLGLTVVTGLVDAFSFLRLERVFVANMTGNIVLLGFRLTGVVDIAVVGTLLAIVAFSLGAAAAGRWSIHRAPHRGHLLATATATQAVLVLGSALVAEIAGVRHAAAQLTTVGLLAVAMGSQTEIARRLAVPDLPTTLVTLTYTGLVSDATTWPVRIRRTVTILAMLGGALAGGALLRWVSLAAPLWLAAAILITCAVGAEAATRAPGSAAWR